MAVAYLDRFQAGIAITDTPIGYAPGLGQPINFTIAYHQRQINQPATFTYSNMGQQWNCGWISYVTGGPTSGMADATFHASSGNEYTYTGYQETPNFGGTTEVKQGDFQGNEGWTHATLHYRQNPERYERWLPDGTVEVYSQPCGTSASTRLFFLTYVIDPQHNTTTLNYDPTAAANGQAVLTSVTDPTGSQLLFSYGSSSPLLITKVARSKDNLAATFEYTASGQLASSTDPLGITSSFHYASSSNFIDRMTTPYGTTTFSSTDGASFLEADMTNPLDQNERVEYQENLSTSLFSDTESTYPTATGLTIDNTRLNTSNTFYWNRRAMSTATPYGGTVTIDTQPFYANAQVTHWAQSGLGSIPVPLSTKRPLEGRVWYNYPGQSNIDFVLTDAPGASVRPIVTARYLDGGTTQASYATYNANGFVTQAVDPLSRTTNFTYDPSNNIDLLTVQQVNGSGQDLLSTITYNSQHEPLSVKDASGQTTSFSYFANGLLHTTTNAKGETTTLAYDGSDYLSTVTGPVSGATVGYMHDSAGRVHTITDSESYILTFGYDNLDRLVSTTYPDGTTDLVSYNKLDVAKTTDRQGRSTYQYYDAIRQPSQTVDPQGRNTFYTWCTCGGLSTLTDANNNVTTWTLDLQGRITAKTFADCSAINYSYETNTSRLHQMTDAKSNVSTYSYNLDNTLASVAYTVTTNTSAAYATSPTNGVSFTYDPVYNRVTDMNDGTGHTGQLTTHYAYNAIPSGAAASPTTGAGRLSTVTVPIIGTTSAATVAYGYDALGRVTSRSVDGGSNSASSTFDSLGRVTGVSNPLGAFTYNYVDTTDRLSSLTYPSGTGLSTVYSYFDNTHPQDFERLQTIQNFKASGATNVSRFDYTYKPVGTIATWKQQADSATATQYNLTYDYADQLVDAEQVNTSTSATVTSNVYGYDPAGNRRSETTLSGTTTAGQVNNLNQLTAYGTLSTQTVSGYASSALSSATVNGNTASITGSTNFSAYVPLPPGTNVVSVVARPSTGAPATQRVRIVATGTALTALTYDANGNCTQDETGNTYTWDALNRLTAIVYGASSPAYGTHTEFAYDGLSRRVQIVERAGATIGAGTVSSTKNYLWEGTQLAEERDASNTVTKRFFPQGEQQISGGTTTLDYYTTDQLNSVREMMDGSGNIVARYSYDPYGRTTLVSGTNLATFQYADMYMHQTSGLNLTLAGDGQSTGRAYDSTAGRWLSRDPLGEKGGINLYGYVANDPINGIDSLGLAGVGVQVSAAAEVGNFDSGAGATGQVGSGLFVNNNNYAVTDGSFASGGAFAGTPSSNVQFPGGTGQTPWVGGASAGGGVGFFFTNANSVSDLQGPFYQYNVNLLFGSISIAYDPTSGNPAQPWTWTSVVSITVGKGVGISISGYSTTTAASCPGQLAPPPTIPIQKLGPPVWN